MATRAPLVTGILFALGAGLTWGLVFIGPLLLPEYPATLQSFGRYLAFGLIALPLGWLDRRALRQLTPADWRVALGLALIGNVVYYLLLASAIRRAGGPLPTLVIGTLPVVIAIAARRLRQRVDARAAGPSWRRLAPSLGAIALGIALVNHAEWRRLEAAGSTDLPRYAGGALLAAGAVVCWTWYPIRNGVWLRAHPGHSPRAWATAQGLATLPLAFVGYAATWAWEVAGPVATGGAAPAASSFPMPFGPRPAAFVLSMVTIGLLASWLGTLCWNEASQRLPATLAGQLIVFETLAALAYAFALRGAWPPPATLAGAALLIAGVAWAARSEARPA